MARNDPHLWDLVADELTDWLDVTAQRAADEIMRGGQAPFAAKATDKARRDYFQAQFFLPDGQPNEQGRQAMLDRHGVGGYTRIWGELQKSGDTSTASDVEIADEELM